MVEVERSKFSSEKLKKLNLHEDLKNLARLRSKLLPATSWMALLKHLLLLFPALGEQWQ